MMNCNALWTWMDQHPPFYFAVVGSLVALALVMAIIPLVRDEAEDKRGHDWIWGLLIVAILAAGRWPSIFFPRELNPDEGLLVAGARVLLHDPVFWRSFDGGTSGPLDYFPLWPAGWLFGWKTFFTARITALTLLGTSLVFTHQCMAIVLGRRVARVAILAPVCLEALTNAADFLHYSTEILPVALLSVTVYAAVRRWVERNNLLWTGLGGLLLGAIPLAKIQAVPLAACMGLAWLLAEFFSKEPNPTRRISYLMIGALLPASLFACQITIAGEWNNVIIPYFICNVQYTESGAASLEYVFSIMLQNSYLSDSLLHLWLPGIAVWLGLMVRLRRSTDRGTRIFLLAGLVAVVLAVLCVILPSRPFLHYWQLAIVPVTFLVGAVTGNLLSTSTPASRHRDRWLVAVCLFGLVSTLLTHRAWKPSYFMGYRAFFQEYPYTDLSIRIMPKVQPGDTLAIWGWSHYVYVETGLRQATRDANSTRLIDAGPYREFYRDRFLRDFVHAMPTFFLDSIGPCSLQYGSPEFRHDNIFPELAAVIRAKYLLIDEISGARLYRRRDAIPQ